MSMSKHEIAEFGAWVKSERNKLGITQQHLAKMLNIGHSTLRNLEIGVSPALGVKTETLLREFFQDPKKMINLRTTRNIPVLKTVAPGATQIVDSPREGRNVPIISQAAAATVNTRVCPLIDYINEYGDGRTQFFPEAKENDFAFEVSGDSMLPYYPERTLLLLRSGMRIPNGAPVVAVLYNGEIIFKLFYARNCGQELALVSINNNVGQTYHFTLQTAWQVRDVYRVISSFRDEVAISDAVNESDIDVWARIDRETNKKNKNKVGV